MKRLLHFIAASLASLSLSATAADKPATKARPRGLSERTCALTITWWEQPVLAEGESLENAVKRRGEEALTDEAAKALGKLLGGN